MKRMFVFLWCMAGLLTLDIVLRAGPAGSAVRDAAVDSLPAVTALRTRCELPAGTLVFVVAPEEEQ